MQTCHHHHHHYYRLNKCKENAIRKRLQLITALRQCWTVCSCQTSSFISILSIILETLTQPSLFFSTFTHSFLVFQPLPLLFVPSICNSQHADTQSLLSLRFTCLYYVFRLRLTIVFDAQPLPNGLSNLQTLSYPSMSHHTIKSKNSKYFIKKRHKNALQ